jgi:signal transduction histidine kinase
MKLFKTKPGLFIKIYLWFWLATIIIIVSLFIFDRVTDTRIIDHLRIITGHALSLHGKTAIDILERDGISSLNNYLSYVEDGTGLKIFIFDGKGNEIRGQKAPPQMITLISSAEKNSDSAVDNNFVIQNIQGGNTKKYIIAAEIKLRPPFALKPQFKPEGQNIEPPPTNRPPSPGLFASAFGPRPGPHPPGPPPFMPFPHDINPFSILSRIVLALSVSGIGCYFLSRYLTAPITGLRNATRHFAAGNFSTRVSATMSKRRDELSGLASDFDFMAERIEMLMTSQQILLRDISHELRSPLARMNVALELCRKRCDSETEKYLDRIGKEADKLNDLIGQVLTLNRVKYGINQLRKEEINISRLIEEIALDADYEANAKNRSVNIAISDECVMEGDRELLRRAVENMVRNAVLYTAEKSTVEIYVKQIQKDENDYVSIIVRDFGTGVPEEEIKNIFKPFYRIGEGRDRMTGGAGIGLAIADVAVRLHGGSIKAINASGGGLNIEVMLPIKSNKHSS